MTPADALFERFMLIWYRPNQNVLSAIREMARVAVEEPTP